MSSPRRIERLVFDPARPEHLVAHPDDGDPAELLPLVADVLALAANRERWAKLPPFFMSARTDAGRHLVARHDGELMNCWLVTDALYNDVNDPWAITERFPIEPHQRGPIPAEEWPLAEPADAAYSGRPRRRITRGRGADLVRRGPVARRRRALRVSRGERRRIFSPTLDAVTHGHAAVVGPDDVRGRRPAGVLAVRPRKLAGGGRVGVSDPVRAENYPEGRYESRLQYAVEHGDEREVQRLLARRTPAQTARLALALIAGMVGFTLLGGFLRQLGG